MSAFLPQAWHGPNLSQSQHLVEVSPLLVLATKTKHRVFNARVAIRPGPLDIPQSPSPNPQHGATRDKPIVNQTTRTQQQSPRRNSRVQAP
jgi:hypothetical protein